MRTTMALLVALLAVACSSLTFPDDDPTMEGEIVGVEDSPATIWVKEDPDDNCGIVFTLGPADIGERMPDGSIQPRGIADLTVGVRVKVWSGSVAESCPGQAAADAVEIL